MILFKKALFLAVFAAAVSQNSAEEKHLRGRQDQASREMKKDENQAANANGVAMQYGGPNPTTWNINTVSGAEFPNANGSKPPANSAVPAVPSNIVNKEGGEVNEGDQNQGSGKQNQGGKQQKQKQGGKHQKQKQGDKQQSNNDGNVDPATTPVFPDYSNAKPWSTSTAGGRPPNFQYTGDNSVTTKTEDLEKTEDMETQVVNKGDESGGGGGDSIFACLAEQCECNRHTDCVSEGGCCGFQWGRCVDPDKLNELTKNGLGC